MPKFSIVIPIYNEEKSILPLYSSLKSVMARLNQSYEILFVNDGSTDRSLEVLKNINSDKSSLIIASLSRRWGQPTAMQAGFAVTRGELIITMDGDLQTRRTYLNY